MNQRYYSLDVFRGATVALMILVNNPGSWSHIFEPLKHAPWHGCTPTDLVFPFFLFAVGNALAFVLPRLEAQGTKTVLTKIFTRTLWIFAIGIFLNWSPFVRWSNDSLVFKYWVDPVRPETGIRILGVLQRIALCYLFASLIIHFFKIRGAFVSAAILLLGYWWLCIYENPTDPFSLEGWFGTEVDRSILGIAHMYKGEGVPFDPEGIASTFPAISQVLFGFFVGHYIREKGKQPEMLNHLFVTGLIFTCVGYFWDLSIPINKKIWTSSFVCYTTGLAILLLSIFIHQIEFQSSKKNWSYFFEVFGKNPLFIFVLSGFLPRLLALLRWTDQTSPEGVRSYTSPLPWFYSNICERLIADQRVASLTYALLLVLFYFVIAMWLDRKKIYIRV